MKTTCLAITCNPHPWDGCSRCLGKGWVEKPEPTFTVDDALRELLHLYPEGTLCRSWEGGRKGPGRPDRIRAWFLTDDLRLRVMLESGPSRDACLVECDSEKLRLLEMDAKRLTMSIVASQEVAGDAQR